VTSWCSSEGCESSRDEARAPTAPARQHPVDVRSRIDPTDQLAMRCTVDQGEPQRGEGRKGVAVQMGDVAVTSESMSCLFRRKGSRCWPGVWFPLMRSFMPSTLDDLSTSRGCAPETAISFMPTATAPWSYHWIWRKRFDRLLTFAGGVAAGRQCGREPLKPPDRLELSRWWTDPTCRRTCEPFNGRASRHGRRAEVRDDRPRQLCAPAHLATGPGSWRYEY
jgi:hypothetical protein